MKKSDWIPIENLPEKMEHNGLKMRYSHHVLVFDGKTKYVAFYSYEFSKWHLAHGKVHDFDFDMLKSKPTHWMPLPENP